LFNWKKKPRGKKEKSSHCEKPGKVLSQQGRKIVLQKGGANVKKTREDQRPAEKTQRENLENSSGKTVEFHYQ